MMKNLKISVLLVLTVVLVFAMGTQAFAADLPSANVTEVTGDALTVTLTDGSGFGALDGGTYTMDKAATFSTNYTDDALKASDLEEYGDWICDFKITLKTADGNGVNGDDVILIGSYGTYGNIGFKASGFSATLADGSYDIMATTGLDDNLTYKDVVNSVGTFTCGLVDVDGNLPKGVEISVQLVMYEDYARTIVHNIGAPIVYEKYDVKITGKDAYVGDNGEGNLRFISTIGTDEEVIYYGTWIVPENYFDAEWTNAADLWDADEVEKGDSYTADIYGIPASYLAKTFYAMSYIGTESDDYYSDIATAVIDEIKNFTSN